MAGRTGKRGCLRKVSALLSLGWLLIAGCAVGAGNRLTLFPSGNPLLDEVRAVCQSPAETLPVARELDKHVQGPYVVEPGDILLIHPVDLDSPVRLPGDQPVLPDGTIHLGLYGPVEVAGKTLNAIEAEINALVRLKTPAAGLIMVRLIGRQSKCYYVLGEVNAPGAYPLSGRETVLDGLVAAGGLTERASRTDVILARPTAPNACRIVLPICYNQIVQLGDTSTNYQLAPGDRIFVAGRGCGKVLFPFGPARDRCPCLRPQCPCVLPVTERGACPESLAPAPAVALGQPEPLPAEPTMSGHEMSWRPVTSRYGK